MIVVVGVLTAFLAVMAVGALVGISGSLHRLADALDAQNRHYGIGGSK